MEASIKTLVGWAQVERASGDNEFGATRPHQGKCRHKIIFHSLKEEITQLRVTIETQIKVMTQQNYDDAIPEWKE
uniref:Uncharacterized protein n=1 Tax=Cucumis melo TaxID=3656 RepID=A0A9I9CFX2_CUCME